MSETDRIQGYAEANGLHCFMYVTGAVFAATVPEANQIAGRYGLAGDTAREEYRELLDDMVAARRRAAGREVRNG